MFNLIASISAEKVYQMDDHMFNWIGNEISVLSILVALIAFVAPVIGFISFKRTKKEINNIITNADESLKRYEENINDQDKKIKEIEKLKKQLNLELIKLKQINFDIIVNNIHNVIIQLPKYLDDNELSFKLTELVNSINTLIFSIPDKKLTAKQGIYFLGRILAVTNYISVITTGIPKVKTDKNGKEILNKLEVLCNKISFRNIDTNNMSKEDEERIQSCLSQINDLFIEIEANMEDPEK